MTPPPDFGPDSVGATGAPPFSVTGPTTAALDGSRSATVSFAVTNLTGRAVRARLAAEPIAGAEPAWFTVVGETERAVGVAGTTTVDLGILVPATAAAGTATMTLSVSLEDQPEQTASGPTVTFAVPAPARRAFPSWIVVVAIAAVLLLGGGLIWWITRESDEVVTVETETPTPTPTPTTPTDEPSPLPTLQWIPFPPFAVIFVEFTGSRTLDGGTALDLDRNDGDAFGVNDIRWDAELFGSSALSSADGTARLAVVSDAEFTTCNTASLTSEIDSDQLSVGSLICVVTDTGSHSILTVSDVDDGFFGSLDVGYATWNL